MMQVVGKENKKNPTKILKDLITKFITKVCAYGIPGRRQEIPHTSTEHGWNISGIYVMATQWFYCALLNSAAWR